jgi:hypothetical protein
LDRTTPCRLQCLIQIGLRLVSLAARVFSATPQVRMFRSKAGFSATTLDDHTALDLAQIRIQDWPMRRPSLAVLLVVAIRSFTPSVSAQSPGKASFVVYEKDQRIGTLDTEVMRTADGWRIRSSMQTKGLVPVTIVNLDLLYDRNWFGRWMTMEMKQPDEVIVHVAVARTTAQTDVVRAKEARFRSSSVSPNTILRPERAYGAYEAVAARLAAGTARDLPLFVPPTGETRAIVESVSTERVRTTAGEISAQHYVLTEITGRPTRVDLWTHAARMLRLDLPATQISVRRSDVRP